MEKKPVPSERRGLFPALRREPFAALRAEMEDLFERFWGEGDRWLSSSAMMSPSLDLEETDTTFEVRLDLPGLKPENINVEVSGNVLTISGKREEKEEQKDRRFHRIERRGGSFSRSVTLPSHVVKEQVSADYRDGVLTIKMPKVEAERPHKVDVKT